LSGLEQTSAILAKANDRPSNKAEIPAKHNAIAEVTMVAGTKTGASKAAKISFPTSGMATITLPQLFVSNAQLTGESAKLWRLEYTFSLKKRLVLFTFVIELPLFKKYYFFWSH
jgi:hypothetical protein